MLNAVLIIFVRGFHKAAAASICIQMPACAGKLAQEEMFASSSARAVCYV